MAVYRERKRIHPALLIGLAAVGIAVLILAVALIFFRLPPADPMIEARMKASEAAQGLEVFTIEYPQGAQGAELAGALGALARAQAAFKSAQDELAKIDAAAVEQIAADFAALKDKAEARAPAEEVLPLAEALREKLLALAGG